MGPTDGTLLILAHVLCSAWLVSGAPPINHLLTGEKNEAYSFTFDKLEIKGKCQQLIYVKGKGIKDTFKVSCNNNGVSGIKSLDFLIYENPGDSLSLLSENSGELIVIKEGVCRLRQYTTVGRKTTSVSSTMSDTDCDAAKNRIKKGANGMISSYSEDMTRYLFGGIWRLFPQCFPFCISTAILQALKPTIPRYKIVPEKKPEEPEKKPEESDKSPEEPEKKPEEPVKKPEEPVKKPEEPVKEPEEPLKKPEEPVKKPEESGKKPDDPVKNPEEPVKKPEEPAKKPGVPDKTPEVPKDSDENDPDDWNF